MLPGPVGGEIAVTSFKMAVLTSYTSSFGYAQLYLREEYAGLDLVAAFAGLGRSVFFLLRHNKRIGVPG